MFDESKQRIIQEYVPGKQVTLAHVIANPVGDLYRKIGAMDDEQGALGILTITPSEAAIIAADICTKSGEVEIVFVDRFSGSVIISGDVSSVESSLKAVLEVLCNKMGFAPAEITKT